MRGKILRSSVAQVGGCGRCPFDHARHEFNPLQFILRVRCAGFSLWRFLRYIREEILIVFGTSTSESALAPLMAKLEAVGKYIGVFVQPGRHLDILVHGRPLCCAGSARSPFLA